MGGHARLSASSANRWLNCAGSVVDDRVDSSSPAAAAGTYAHSIAEQCLNAPNYRHPKDWLGNKTIVDGHTIECDQEMVDALDVYIEAIYDGAEPGDLTWVEMPLLEALQTIDQDFGGTADFVRYRPSTYHLKVTDLKFGSGMFVSAENNKQAKMYALGAMVSCGKLVHTVEIEIVQPRHHSGLPVRSETFQAVDLLDYMADLKEAAEATRAPGAADNLNAGEWCTFCDRVKDCPELIRKQAVMMATQFDIVPQYDVKELATVLGSVGLVKQRIKAIEEFAYTEANRGVEIPGFKLVEKRATRKWASEDDIKQWGEANGVDVYGSPPLMSPPQVEAVLKATAPRGKKTEAAQVLEPFIVAISSGNTLVPDADKRQPVKLITAEDFGD